MKKLVFLEPSKIDAVPYTTSDIVAECAEISYRSVQKTIEKHKSALEQFGIMRFEITISGKAGRPKIVYNLNEEQATLLITFLKNTPVVVIFKVELVRQFYLMKNELLKRRVYREELKPIRRELTDVIQTLPGSNKWAYKNYTDLAYKTAIGKSAAQLRKERNADKKAVAADYMTSNELQNITKTQYQIAVLVDLGMNYNEVKNMMSSKGVQPCRI
jgi:phage regulator Rha-like protein